MNKIKLIPMILSLNISACNNSESVFDNDNHSEVISERIYEENLNELEKYPPSLRKKIAEFAKNHKISIALAIVILSTAEIAAFKNKHKISNVFADYNQNNPVVLIDEMVNKINRSHFEREATYIYNNHTKNIDYFCPHHILGDDIDENDIRKNPKNYFEQDNDGYVYVKDTNNVSHCGGKFFIRSLGNLRENNINNSKSDGKLVFVYGNTALLDSCVCLNSKKFDLANVASNHNGIETLPGGDFEKKFSDYPYDNTQGPTIMIGFPFTSFILLHLFNGKKIKNHMSPLMSCNMFNVNSYNSYELNLLKAFGVKTSAGYVINNSLKDTTFDNDNNFHFLTTEDAPLLLKKLNKSYEIQKNPHRMTLFIAAAIPKYGFCGSEASDSQVKKYLKMYYESLFRYCASKGIKNALISPIGAGVFGVPIEWHFEIWDNMQNLIKQSGTTYWINGHNKNYDSYEKKYEKIKFKNVSNVKSLDEIMNLAR